MNDKKGNKIIVVGGSISGLTAAKRARRLDENIDITLIDDSKYLCYPLPALPLFISGQIDKLESIYTKDEDKFSAIYNIKILKSHRVLEIDKNENKISVRNLKSEKKYDLKYDKLILATGGKYNPPKLNFKKVDNIFTLNNLEEAINIKEYINKTSAKKVTIVGSNYHALITANCFLKSGFEVVIIDKKTFDDVDFDPEFRFFIKDELAKNGAQIFINSTIKKYIKSVKEKINTIEINNGIQINTHLILFFNNYSSNIELAEKSSLEMSRNRKLIVNDNLETSEKNILAVGGIIERGNVLTEDISSYSLAMHSQKQGRLAGSVAAGVNISILYSISTKILKIKDYSIGVTGLNLNTAKKYGINAFSVTLFSGDKDRYSPQSEKIHFKITVDRDNNKVIGAQICGKGDGVDKQLDTLAVIIYSGLTVDEVASIDFSYSPELNNLRNPINTLGMIASNYLNNLTIPKRTDEILFGENITLLDIRNKNEYKKSHVEGALFIPLNELRDRIDEVPKENEIFIYGHTGIRGYIAERILKGNGFEKVYNVEGGITAIKMLESMS